MDHSAFYTGPDQIETPPLQLHNEPADQDGFKLTAGLNTVASMLSVVYSHSLLQ